MKPASAFLLALLAFLCCSGIVAGTAQSASPEALSEGVLMRLLHSRNIAKQHVADLVAQHGVSFPLTVDVEKELRAAGATDEVIAAIRNVAAQRTTGASSVSNEDAKNKQASGSAASGDLQASLLLHPDAACIVFLDGTEVKSLQTGESARVPVGQGEHIVQATSANSGFRIEKRVTVSGPGQMIVDLPIGAEESATAENAQKLKQKQALAIRQDWKASSSALVAELNIQGQKRHYLVSNDGNTCELKVKLVDFSSRRPAWDFGGADVTTATINEGHLKFTATDANHITVEDDKVRVRGRTSTEVFSGYSAYIDDKFGKANPIALSCSDGHLENGHKCTPSIVSLPEFSFVIADGPERAQAIADQLKTLARACAPQVTP